MKHFFTSFSFQVRIVLLFAIVDAIVLFLGITFFYMYNKNVTRENWEKVVKQTALLFSSRADNFIDVIDETTKRVHASKDVLEIARNLSLNQEIDINQYDYNSRHDYFSEHPKIRQEIQSILLNATITINHALLGRLSVLTTNFDRVSIYNRIGDLPLKKEKIKNMNVYQLGFNLTEYSALFGPYTDPWNNNQDLVMTLVRPLRDTFSVYGLICYTISLQQFIETIHNFAIEKDDFFVILNNNDELILSSGFTNEFTNTTQNEVQLLVNACEQGKNKKYTYKNNAYLLSTVQLKHYNWKLLFGKSFKNMDNKKSFHIYLLLAIFIFSLVLAVFVYFFMVKHIINQNLQILTKKESELKARMNALEGQLDTHFLYNSLAVIGACGAESGAKIVSTMCNQLAKLLRYSVSVSTGTILLKAEIENSERYLYIMKMRFGDTFFYSFDINLLLLEIKVPKLILQPIYENCFKHGFNLATPPWIITTKLFIKKNSWCVRIENSGVPPDPKQIRKIYDKLAAHKADTKKGEFDYILKDSKGLGLTNTRIRLYLLYQGAELFEIGVQDGKTYVEIGGPLEEKSNQIEKRDRHPKIKNPKE